MSPSWLSFVRPQPCQKYVRGAADALGSDAVVRLVAVETQHYSGMCVMFFFSYLPSFFSSFYLQSRFSLRTLSKSPPGRRRGCVRQRRPIPPILCFLSPFFTRLSKPDPTPSQAAGIEWVSTLSSSPSSPVFLWISLSQQITGRICVRLSLFYSCSKFHTAPPAIMPAQCTHPICSHLRCSVGC